MYWANFLHFYQPPTQKPFWIKKIAAESYRPILAGLKAQGKTKLTLNVSGILLEHLDRCGEKDVIGLLRELLDSGQIELTGSAKYHPLLPYLPDDEIVRQIRLNEETLKKYFGSLWKPAGFFPPEMGVSVPVAQTVHKLGYRWMIADELSFPKTKGAIDYSKIYTVNGLGDFAVYFRERRMSWVILSGQVGTGTLLLESLGDRLHSKTYLLTAMDGETFGHHRPGLERLLFELYAEKEITSALISELPSLFPAREAITPVPSTWALMDKDLEEKKPFSRWNDPENAIHKMQWELTNLAIKTVHEADPGGPKYRYVRDLLDQALHSDQYWWASAKPWWSIEMIERGARELADVIRKTPDVPSAATSRAEELYKNIIFTAFDWQRDGIVDELSRKEDEEIRQRTDAALPRLPAKEIEKMVAVLKKELTAVVKSEEFERAAQIRDRIKELKRYAADIDAPQFVKERAAELP